MCLDCLDYVLTRKAWSSFVLRNLRINLVSHLSYVSYLCICCSHAVPTFSATGCTICNLCEAGGWFQSRLFMVTVSWTWMNVVKLNLSLFLLLKMQGACGYYLLWSTYYSSKKLLFFNWQGQWMAMLKKRTDQHDLGTGSEQSSIVYRFSYNFRQ